MSIKAVYEARIFYMHVEMSCEGAKCVINLGCDDYGEPLTVEVPISDMRFLEPMRRTALVRVAVEVVE